MNRLAALSLTDGTDAQIIVFATEKAKPSRMAQIFFDERLLSAKCPIRALLSICVLFEGFAFSVFGSADLNLCICEICERTFSIFLSFSCLFTLL